MPINGQAFKIDFTSGKDTEGWSVSGKYSTSLIKTDMIYKLDLEANLIAPVDLQLEKKHILLFALGFKDRNGTEIVKCSWDPKHTRSGWLFSK
jgi:hypothetical protein